MDDELDGQILGGSRQSFCRECSFSINDLGLNLGGSRLPCSRDHVSGWVLQQPLHLLASCENCRKSCSYPGWEGTILGGSRLPFYSDLFLE